MDKFLFIYLIGSAIYLAWMSWALDVNGKSAFKVTVLYVTFKLMPFLLFIFGVLLILFHFGFVTFH